MNHLPPPVSFAEFAERVLCLCALRHASITSTVRTDSRNARVRGSSASKHRLPSGSWAADLVLDDQENQIGRESLVNDAHQLGLWALDEGDHVHVQGMKPGTPLVIGPLG